MENGKWIMVVTTNTMGVRMFLCGHLTSNIRSKTYIIYIHMLLYTFPMYNPKKEVMYIEIYVVCCVYVIFSIQLYIWVLPKNN